MRVRALGVVLSLLIFASSAHADMITLGAGDPTLGASFWRLTNSGGPFLMRTPYNPTRIALGVAGGSGSFIEEWQGCYEVGACWSSWTATEIQFDTPTNVVELTSRWRNDGSAMYALDVDGHIIGSCFSPFGQSGGGCATSEQVNPDLWFSRLTIDTGQRNIASVVFGGYFFGASMTEVSYRVPEPSTGLLALMGIGGLVRLTRARHANSSMISTTVQQKTVCLTQPE